MQATQGFLNIYVIFMEKKMLFRMLYFDFSSDEVRKIFVYLFKTVLPIALPVIFFQYWTRFLGSIIWSLISNTDMGEKIHFLP